MGLIKAINAIQGTMLLIEDALAEFYKQLILLDDEALRNELLVKFGKIDQAREWHYESVEELIELIDERLRM